MASSIGSVSQTELAQRRQRLRYRRRLRLLQMVWQVLAVGSLAGGLVWVATLPAWVIRRPEQVMIEGNQYLPVQTIRSLLPIPYPQSLLRVAPQAIVDDLKTKAPIAEVAVSRRLFPPGLIVQVKERLPVAIAIPVPTDATKTAKKDTLAKTGLLDEKGIWIPLDIYTSLDQSLKLPTLKVIGDLEQYRHYWSKLYQDISRSPVKISEIDWRNPNNLILKTELGTIHFGAYGSQFNQQLVTLDRMRRLSTHPSFNQIAYIDLRSPDAPMVQMIKSKDLVKSGNP